MTYEHPTRPNDRASGFAPDGYAWAGTHGRARHVGEPLTREQIGMLNDGAEVVITWFGGNGPHPYRVLVDSTGQRRIESLYCDPLPSFRERITRGWDPVTRGWFNAKPPEPEHIRWSWMALRNGGEFTTNEAARLLGVTVSTITRYARDGHLPYRWHVQGRRKTRRYLEPDLRALRERIEHAPGNQGEPVMAER